VGGEGVIRKKREGLAHNAKWEPFQESGQILDKKSNVRSEWFLGEGENLTEGRGLYAKGESGV